ncbi:MAG TPA: DUF2182 domain-containing protein [Candidatus Limnocylindria bacterium]|nr:DUF2182 domain-containing protein [Candidatus Limnocylindria bacterium]
MLLVALAAIVAAWILVLLAQLTGAPGALHHHELIEGDLPLWVAVPIFVLAWQVMIAAMMLPSSLPTLRVFGRSLPAGGGRALGGFLVAYAGVWTLFGLAAFAGDVALHRVVETFSWLEARPWLLEASALGLAGAYQFSALKRRGLAACRHPAGPALPDASRWGAARHGLRHGLECVAGSWALMLLMFAVGVANPWWMAALTAVMAYEAMGRHGPRAASVIGITLLGLACLAVVSGGAIGFEGR